jgi:hypothetical protein
VAEEEMSLLLLLHSEGPEEVALEEDLQMDEVLVGAWLEVVDIAPMKALVGAWAAAVDIVLMKALVAWVVAVDIVLMKALAVAWAVVVDIAPMKALVEEWAVDIAPMKALVVAWVLAVDIVPMKVLDMGDPIATGHMMALVTEAMTIEGHHLMNTVAMMVQAMEEATEGMMEATVMEEVRVTFRVPFNFLESGERQNIQGVLVLTSLYAWHFLPSAFAPIPKVVY